MSWSEKISAGDWPAIMQSVAEAIVTAVFVVTFLLQAFTIPSESMEHTCWSATTCWWISFATAAAWGGIAFCPIATCIAGDIVVFHYPVNPAQDFVKRVVALPGDRLRLINKRVYINGALVAEPYTQYIPTARSPYLDDFPRTESPEFAVNAKW